MIALKSLVLIADDDPVARKILQLLLERLGCRIESVATGGQALAAARQMKPDLLLLDVNMPDIDGFAVCQALRGDRSVAEMPIIMLTALSDREARLRGLEAGADDFISKPFDQVELSARLTTVLRLNRYRRVQEAQHLEQQVEMASAIQQLLLPKSLPLINGLELGAVYRPASKVGGDFFDFIEYGRQLYFVVADVSGHGLASALFMSNTRSAIRSLVDTSTDLTHLAERLNTRVFDDSGDSGVFVSGVIGCYDPANRQLAFVNCGHPEPLILRRDGRLERIAAGSAPLGMTHPLGASVVSTSLGAGDLVCLYTDGLVEASNACGEMFATERLEQRLQVDAGDSLDEMSSDILTAVQGFHGGPALDDDFTLVLLRGINRV